MKSLPNWEVQYVSFVLGIIISNVNFALESLHFIEMKQMDFNITTFFNS